MFMLTPPLAALRNLLLFSISEEFTYFSAYTARGGMGGGWGGMLTFICTCTSRGCLRCCYVGHGLGWGGMLTFILHTTWMLRCCYVGHGLGWGGMLTFICTCTPRGCYVCCYVGHGVRVGVYLPGVMIVLTLGRCLALCQCQHSLLEFCRQVHGLNQKQ